MNPFDDEIQNDTHPDSDGILGTREENEFDPDDAQGLEYDDAPFDEDDMEEDPNEDPYEGMSREEWLDVQSRRGDNVEDADDAPVVQEKTRDDFRLEIDLFATGEDTVVPKEEEKAGERCLEEYLSNPEYVPEKDPDVSGPIYSKDTYLEGYTFDENSDVDFSPSGSGNTTLDISDDVPDPESGMSTADKFTYLLDSEMDSFADMRYAYYLEEKENGIKTMYAEQFAPVMETIAHEVKNGAAYTLDQDWAKTVYSALIHDKIDPITNGDYKDQVERAIEKADVYYSHPGSPTGGDYPLSFLSSFAELYQKFTGKEYEMPVPNSEKIEIQRPYDRYIQKAEANKDMATKEVKPDTEKPEEILKPEIESSNNQDADIEKQKEQIKEAFSCAEDVFGRETLSNAFEKAIEQEKEGVPLVDAIESSLKKELGMDSKQDIDTEKDNVHQEEKTEKPKYGTIEYHKAQVLFYEDKIKQYVIKTPRNTFYTLDNVKMLYHAYKADIPIKESGGNSFYVTKANIFLGTIEFLRSDILTSLILRECLVYSREKRTNDVEKEDPMDKESPKVERVPRDIDSNPEFGKVEHIPDKESLQLYRNENPDYGKYYGVDTTRKPSQVEGNMRAWATGKSMEYYVDGKDSLRVPNIRMVEIEKNSHCHVSPFGNVLHVDRLNNPDAKVSMGGYIRSFDISREPKIQQQLENLAASRGITSDELKNQITKDCKESFVTRISAGMEKEIPRLEKQIENQGWLKENIGRYEARIEAATPAGQKDNTAIQGFRENLDAAKDRSDTYVKMLENRIEKIRDVADNLGRMDIETKYEQIASSEVTTIARTREYEPLDPKDMESMDKYIDKQEKDHREDVTLSENHDVETEKQDEEVQKDVDRKEDADTVKETERENDKIEPEKEDTEKNPDLDDNKADIEKPEKDDAEKPEKDDTEKSEKDTDKSDQGTEKVDKEDFQDNDLVEKTQEETEISEQQPSDIESHNLIEKDSSEEISEPVDKTDSEGTIHSSDLENEKTEQENVSDLVSKEDPESIRDGEQEKKETEPVDTEKIEEKESELIDKAKSDKEDSASAKGIDQEDSAALDDQENTEKPENDNRYKSVFSDTEEDAIASSENQKPSSDEIATKENDKEPEKDDKKSDSPIDRLISDTLQDYIEDHSVVSFAEDIMDMFSSLSDGYTFSDLVEGFKEVTTDYVDSYINGQLDKIDSLKDLACELFNCCPAGPEVAKEELGEALSSSESIPEDMAEEILSGAEQRAQDINIEIPQTIELTDNMDIVTGETGGISDPVSGEALDGLSSEQVASNLENAVDAEVFRENGGISDLVDKGLSAEEGTLDIEILDADFVPDDIEAKVPDTTVSNVEAAADTTEMMETIEATEQIAEAMEAGEVGAEELLALL